MRTTRFDPVRCAKIARRALLATQALVLMAAAFGCGAGGRGPVTRPPSPPSGVAFVDATARSGIDYRWTLPGTEPRTIGEVMGNGCAFLDYDNSGNLSVLLVGPKLALYRGDGRGHFVDVTDQTGLDKIHGKFLGCAVGDYDNDGYDDIYLSAYRGGVLLHNDHGVRFTDVTKQAGIAPQPWGTSCGWADVDHSGRLSLFIGNYVNFGPTTVPQLCPSGSLMSACQPEVYAPLRCSLYLNVGHGRFRNVTQAWGLASCSGKDLGVAFADFDGSGHQSVYVANDTVAANLFKFGSGGCEDIAAASGVAYSAAEQVQGGMGVDWGDYDNDGRLDLAVATYEHEPKDVYHNDGHDQFTEYSARLGIAAPTLPNVAFGVKWLDADNDGWLDLLIANGHVEDNVEQSEPGEHFRQATQFFYNEHGIHFVDSSASLEGPARPIVGRGLAIGDYDNDGLEDALVVDSMGSPILLHNVTPHPGHWLDIRLVGTRDNRDGLGSLVTVVAGGLRQVRLCTTGGSYLSASDRRVHVGLGAATKADSVSVLWPSGHVDTYHDVAADRVIRITEGAKEIGT